ncbi:MAG: carboxylating nicotinate-nucleotide diphosphorylase [Thermodesulfobacteriota bacterium]|nr:carboxylating nicotinate-nucleotide diphosphorylase [Thermodesulfobacteriota bacterium]
MKGLDPFVLRDLLKAYLMEDLGHGDITSCHLPGRERTATAVIKAKDEGILAGLPVAAETFSLLDPRTNTERLAQEGAVIAKGTELARVTGPAFALLRAERTALNILQRLSGIATTARKMVDLIASTGTRLVDTRKTTPGLRLLEKYAVTMGGAGNHRMGLYDCAMIKDNHIKVAGSIKDAVAAVKKAIPFTARIEVEVKDLAELEEALDAGAHMVLLDNMDPPTLRQAVDQAKGRALTEASGNITPENILAVAQTGVDYISSGAIIHHAVWLDMNMKIL